MSLLPYVLRISKYTTILYPALMYAVMFYVILNKRKRLGHCVTYFVAIILISHTNIGTKKNYESKREKAMKRELWRFSGLLDYTPSPTEGLRAPGPTN